MCSGKGEGDRVRVLPETTIERQKEQVRRAREVFFSPRVNRERELWFRKEVMGMSIKRRTSVIPEKDLEKVGWGNML